MKIEVGVSNRHCHLTKDIYKILFNKEDLTFKKELKQPGQFASEEVITIEGPKNKIEKVRVLGPLRSYNQVEVSKSDAYKLGVNPPVRNSGDLNGAAEVTLIGPAGSVTLNCCILANRHIHITEEEAKNLNIKDKQKVKIYVNNDKGGVMEGCFKVSKEAYKELHIDIDDANAFLLSQDDIVEIEY